MDVDLVLNWGQPGRVRNLRRSSSISDMKPLSWGLAFWLKSLWGVGRMRPAGKEGPRKPSTPSTSGAPGPGSVCQPRRLSPPLKLALPCPTPLQSRGSTPRGASQDQERLPTLSTYLQSRTVTLGKQSLCPQLQCSGAGVLPRGKANNKNREVFGSDFVGKKEWRTPCLMVVLKTVQILLKRN